MPRRWWQITIFWIALGGALALWLAHRYGGVYRSLSEWQLTHFGFYLPAGTQALIVVVLGLPLLIGLIALSRRDRRRHVVLPGEVVASRVLRLMRTLAIAAAVAAVATLIAGFTLPRPTTQAVRVPVERPGGIEVARDGTATLVGGQPEPRVVLYLQSYLVGERVVAFAMLRGPTGLSGTVPVGRFFVQVERGRDGGYYIPSRTGLLVHDGLPGPVRVLYTYLGVTVPEEHFVLFKEQSILWLPFFQAAAQFGLFALIFGLAAASQNRRLRRMRQGAVVSATI